MNRFIQEGLRALAYSTKLIGEVNVVDQGAVANLKAMAAKIDQLQMMYDINPNRIYELMDIAMPMSDTESSFIKRVDGGWILEMMSPEGEIECDDVKWAIDTVENRSIYCRQVVEMPF